MSNEISSEIYFEYSVYLNGEVFIGTFTYEEDLKNFMMKTRGVESMEEIKQIAKECNGVWIK